MIQQYFCVEDGSAFLRTLLGNVIGIFALSADVDEWADGPFTEMAYPEGSRLSIKLNEFDTHMLESLCKELNCNTSDAVRDALNLSYAMRFGKTLAQRPLRIIPGRIGMASLEEKEFGARQAADNARRVQTAATPSANVYFSPAAVEIPTALNLHTSDVAL